MEAYLNALHVHPIGYIPISAFEGQNITQPSDKLPWWHGMTALEAMDSIEKEKGLEHRASGSPFRMCTSSTTGASSPAASSRAPCPPGTRSPFTPRARPPGSRPWSIGPPGQEEHHQGRGGVGITVTDEFFNKRGELITFASQKPLISNTFRANLFWMGKGPWFGIKSIS